MATMKNITMKQFNGTDYDELNPSTVVSQVDGAVPNTRTINNKSLTQDITLSASDVSAVPTTRTVNSKALSSDITLSASDISAVPTSRTVNSKALNSNITLSASDIKLSDNTTIQATVTDLKSSVSNGKATVASAITDKGVSTSATDSFDTMAGNIRQIQTGIQPIGPIDEYMAAGAIRQGAFVSKSDSQISQTLEGTTFYPLREDFIIALNKSTSEYIVYQIQGNSIQEIRRKSYSNYSMLWIKNNIFYLCSYFGSSGNYYYVIFDENTREETRKQVSNQPSVTVSLGDDEFGTYPYQSTTVAGTISIYKFTSVNSPMTLIASGNAEGSYMFNLIKFQGEYYGLSHYTTNDYTFLYRYSINGKTLKYNGNTGIANGPRSFYYFKGSNSIHLYSGDKHYHYTVDTQQHTLTSISGRALTVSLQAINFEQNIILCNNGKNIAYFTVDGQGLLINNQETIFSNSSTDTNGIVYTTYNGLIPVKIISQKATVLKKGVIEYNGSLSVFGIALNSASTTEIVSVTKVQ